MRLMRRHPPRPSLFPYTTLFRSPHGVRDLRSERRRAGQTAASDLGLGAETQHVSVLRAVVVGERRGCILPRLTRDGDRKSTRLNSSHVKISYAVFCLKKKKRDQS